MLYVSSRGRAKPQPFTEILLEGLAPDGGLFLPEEFPKFNLADLSAMRRMSYAELAFAILSKFADDILTGDLKGLVDKTYTKEIFGSEDVTPVKKLEQSLYLLGLSNGPSLAFKDVALQLLGNSSSTCWRSTAGRSNWAARLPATPGRPPRTGWAARKTSRVSCHCRRAP